MCATGSPYRVGLKGDGTEGRRRYWHGDPTGVVTPISAKKEEENANKRRNERLS